MTQDSWDGHGCECVDGYKRVAPAERILRRGFVSPSQFWFQVSPGSDADGLAPRALSAGSRAERSFITNVWPALDASSVCRKRSVASPGWPSMRRAALARLRSAARSPRD